jgi:hypothetical protein
VQVRTKTLVKNCIVQIDATPFKQWYQTHYGIELGDKTTKGEPVPVLAVGGGGGLGRGEGWVEGI